MLELYEATWHDVVSREATRDPFFKEVWEDLQAFRSHYREWGSRAFLPRKKISSQ